MTTQNISYLEIIPEEILYEIVKKLKLNKILPLCLSDKNLNNKICDSEVFWKRRYLSRFNLTDEIYQRIKHIPWKKINFDIDGKRHSNEYIYPLYSFEFKYDMDKYSDILYIDDMNDILLQYYKNLDIIPKKGDLFFPDDASGKILMFDGINFIYLDYYLDAEEGNLPSNFKILEEPDYFPPKYWHNINENDDSWSGIRGNYLINFNHILYKEELINNFKIDNAYSMYTYFTDIRGVKRKIIFLPSKIDLELSFDVTNDQRNKIIKYFNKMINSDKLFFESYIDVDDINLYFDSLSESSVNISFDIKYDFFLRDIYN